MYGEDEEDGGGGGGIIQYNIARGSGESKVLRFVMISIIWELNIFTADYRPAWSKYMYGS